MDKVHYLWLLSRVEAILPDKLSLSYEQRLLAHAHYARSSPPAFPALHFKPFRFANMSAASGRQRCFARCVSVDRCFASCVAVDFLRLQSSTFKCWDVWGLDRWCRLVGATPPCSTGVVLFRRQGVGGFGTDPQMPAVPSIGPCVCFHLKGSRRNCPLHPGLLPFPLPCPYWLHANCVAYLKSLQVSAPGRCSERSPVHFQLCLSRWVNVTRSQLGFSNRHHGFCSHSEQSLSCASIQAICGSVAEIKQSDIMVLSRALTLPQNPLRNLHRCFRSTIRLTVARADCFMCETPVPSECLEWG